MAESDVQQLAQALTEDADLKAAVERATTPEDVVRIANEKGIALTLDDLTREDGELSEDELEPASGGALTNMNWAEPTTPNINEHTWRWG
jgi:predicted ribosomally synthesized peptide with nif11-like leader